ncbi:MAG TPA: DNA polymerase/3'-5' exonuclease PolX [Gemmatimonadaceae bacterium]|nr:DNA polymerase/3'-5' exonuclease PolX [Gemmatimonadaceae bacterium]
MDSRTAAHTLTVIGSLLELRGEQRFKVRAYQNAARAVLSTDTDDIAPLLRSGELKELAGIGPATLAVLADLVETGESRLLERLREETPEGMAEMLRVPGLGTAKIQSIHQQLGVASLDDLDAAARDGRLAALPGFGKKTAEKVLQSIEVARRAGSRALLMDGMGEAARIVEGLRHHPLVRRAEVAGSIRRHLEIVADIDIVAACDDPARVAGDASRAPGVRRARGEGGTRRLEYVDGTCLDLYCVTPDRFTVALWRATGSAAHVAAVQRTAAAKRLSFDGDTLLDHSGKAILLTDEHVLYSALGYSYVEPELREDCGELDAAIAGTLPVQLDAAHIRGVLHCHTVYSDGTATISEMAEAAQTLGWEYLGISDHSQAAFYAGGLKPDAVARQHDEIDELNTTLRGFRVLKGIEADILADGRLDYDEKTLDSFDFVIGSIHARFGLDRPKMTQRVLKALDDPHLTVLAHPTGRLLLRRDPYALDLDAVIEKAAERGVALELNADPYRIDLSWSYCLAARRRGATISIGPDAHSTAALSNVELGIGFARKAWLEPGDVLNCRSADEVLLRTRRPAAGGAEQRQ